MNLKSNRRHYLILPMILLQFFVVNQFSPVSWGQKVDRVIASRDVPVEFARIGEGHYFIDFGKTTFGNLWVNPTGPPGHKGALVVHLGEALSGPKSVDRKPGGTVRYHRFELDFSGSDWVSPTFHWKGPGWMKSGWLDPPKVAAERGMTPFRYAEIENAPRDLSGDDVWRESYHVPFDDDASEFVSSDPHLNSVWQLCKHSIKATSAFGVYIDGDRERKPYEADILINQLSHYCVDARYQTAQRTLEYILQHPTWPTEWRLQTPIIACNDWIWSGDETLIRRHYDMLVQCALIDRASLIWSVEGK